MGGHWVYVWQLWLHVSGNTDEGQQARQTQCTRLRKLHLKPFKTGIHSQTWRLATRLHTGSVEAALWDEI